MIRKLIYHGRVQGVGFRATTRDIARRHNVSGYVKNLPDRTVELVIAGDASEVEACLAQISVKFQNHIVEIKDSAYETSENLESFSIRY